MPDNRRFKGRSNTNILELIGEGLIGAYGGIQTNPEFGAVGPTPNGQPIGGDPYKAKTVFDRNRAGEMNAEYAARQAEADNAILRAIRQQEMGIPLEVRREREVGGAKIDNELTSKRRGKELDLEFQPRFDELDVAKGAQIGANQMYVTNNVDPTNQQARELYNRLVTPEILAALRSGNAAKTESNTLDTIQAKENQGILQATTLDRSRKALADSRFGAQASEQMLENQPRITQSGIREILQSPVAKEAQIMRERLIPISQGTSLFDDRTGQLRYNNPDPMQSYLEQRTSASNPQQITAPRPNMQGLTTNDLIIDPDSGKILGIKPRQ